MKYVIRWKSIVNGRAGKGTKEFERGEADRLVQELNTEYPGIEHEVIEAPQTEQPPQETESTPIPSPQFSSPETDLETIPSE